LYLNVNFDEDEKAGRRICVELKIRLGSLGEAVIYRYISTELGNVILIGTSIS
jgi:hypothetical protein